MWGEIKGVRYEGAIRGFSTRGSVPGVQGPLAKERYPFRVLDGFG